jgi:hypothetical protein
MATKNTAYPYVSIVNSIEDYPTYLQNIQKNISVQTYVPSDHQQFNINKNSKCYAENQSSSVLNMVPFDEYLHTVDSCKFNAAVKQLNFNSNFSTSFSPENHGLEWDIYNEYFGININKYTDPKSGFRTNEAYQTSGKALNMSNIQNATGNTGIITALVNSSKPFSIEWTGYFMPNIGGNWTFTINCEPSKASVYMWIGDVAVGGYTPSNANISITPSPDVANVFTYTYSFLVGNPYRMRIQYSSQSMSPSFHLVLKDPNGVETNGESNFVQNQEHKDIAYFALVEKDAANTAEGLFKCYVADTTETNVASQIAATNSGFILETIWRLFDPNVENPYLTDGNYLKNDGSTLCVYDRNGNIIHKMGDIGAGELVTFGGEFGDIFIGTTNITNNSKKYPELQAVTNPLFQSTYDKYKTSPTNNTDLSILHVGDTVKCLSDYVLARDHLSILNAENLHDYVRLSNDGKFILFFSDGNLLISTNNSPCDSYTDHKNGEVYYSVNGKSSSPSGFYPYSVDLQNVNTNAHESYLVFTDPNTKVTKKNIMANAVEGSKMIIDDHSYFQYTDFIPQDIQNSTPLPENQTSCKPSCDNNPSCNFYFTYQTNDGKTYCNFDTNYSIPSFAPLADDLGTNIITSTLNVKNVTFKPNDAEIEKNSMERQFYDNIPNEIITDTTILDTAVMDDTMTFDSLFQDLTADYRSAINLANKLTLGLSPGDSIQDVNHQLTELLGKIKSKESFVSNIKEGMKNVKEGFYQDNGYKTGGDQGYATGSLDSMSKSTAQGMIKEIVNNKLVPLEKSANQYSDMLQGVNKNYNTITTNVKNINTIRNYLKKNDKYDFSGNLLMGNEYDSHGNFKKYGLNNMTIEDAVVEDTSNLVYRENTLYILGTITAAALIIAAISIAK